MHIAEDPLFKNDMVGTRLNICLKGGDWQNLVGAWIDSEVILFSACVLGVLSRPCRKSNHGAGSAFDA